MDITVGDKKRKEYRGIAEDNKRTERVRDRQTKETDRQTDKSKDTDTGKKRERINQITRHSSHILGLNLRINSAPSSHT